MLKINLVNHEYPKFHTVENMNNFGIGAIVRHKKSKDSPVEKITYHLRQTNGFMKTVSEEEFKKAQTQIGDLRLRKAYGIY